MITTLMCGHLHSTGLSALESYLKYGRVVVCCHSTDNLETLAPWLDRVKLLVIPKPDTTGWFNFNNTYAQTYVMFEGLREVDTEFVIKVRNDEGYPNMDKYIANIEAMPDKIHVTSLYSFRDTEWKFCMGNHIFASKTNTMLHAMAWGMQACWQANWPSLGIIEGGGGIMIPDKNGQVFPAWSEIFHTVAFLKALGVELDITRSREQMIENFFLTPLDDFPGYMWTHKYSNWEPQTVETWTLPERILHRIEDV